MADDDKEYGRGDKFTYKGKVRETQPSMYDQVKESFETVDDRAQLEAIRRARQTAFRAGIGK